MSHPSFNLLDGSRNEREIFDASLRHQHVVFDANAAKVPEAVQVRLDEAVRKKESSLAGYKSIKMKLTISPDLSLQRPARAKA